MGLFAPNVFCFLYIPAVLVDSILPPPPPSTHTHTHTETLRACVEQHTSICSELPKKETTITMCVKELVSSTLYKCWWKDVYTTHSYDLCTHISVHTAALLNRVYASPLQTLLEVVLERDYYKQLHQVRISFPGSLLHGLGIRLHTHAQLLSQYLCSIHIPHH